MRAVEILRFDGGKEILRSFRSSTLQELNQFNPKKKDETDSEATEPMVRIKELFNQNALILSIYSSIPTR